MKKQTLLFLFFLAIGMLHSTFQRISSQEIVTAQNELTHEQIQNIIDETNTNITSILERELYLPGVSIALVSRDEILWTKGYGYLDISRQQEADANTMFGLLSVSKPVTVTGLMIAVQEGLIDLDIPINAYLPEFHIQSRFSEDPMETITIRHLLSMASGLTHDAPLGNNADPYSPSYEDHINSISQTWLRFRTGERAEYSNLGIELAAYILETVTQRSFTEYIQEKVFTPLGMSRSTYDIGQIKNDPNRAVGNNNDFEHIPLEIPMLAPAGVYASISDMARFMQFHLNNGKAGGKQLIDEDILNQMSTIPFPMKDQVTGYGLGLWAGCYHIGDRDVRWCSHSGGGFGFQCNMKWLPDLGYGVMLMANTQNLDENIINNIPEKMLRSIVELYTGETDQGPSEWLSANMPVKSVDSSYLPAGFEGRYNGTNYDLLFLIKDGRFGMATSNSFTPLTPVSETEFLSDSYIYRFICDSNGNPVSVTRPYDGMGWVLGSRENEPAGPDKKEWAEYAGTYIRKRYGESERIYVFSIKNGWMHFIAGNQDFLLQEHLPGLFFTPDGEAIDFRNATPSFRNIRIYKAFE